MVGLPDASAGPPGKQAASNTVEPSKIDNITAFILVSLRDTTLLIPLQKRAVKHTHNLSKKSVSFDPAIDLSKFSESGESIARSIWLLARGRAGHLARSRRLQEACREARRQFRDGSPESCRLRLPRSFLPACCALLSCRGACRDRGHVHS